MTPDMTFYVEMTKAAAPVLAALTTAGIAAWVAHKFGRIQEGIARQQAETAAAAARTAKNKLKLDLFDRRLAVYQNAREAITKVIASEKYSDEELSQYHQGVHGAKWLFGADLANYLQVQLKDKLRALAKATQAYHRIRTDQKSDEYARDKAAKEKALSDLKDEERILNGMFVPYLRLDS